MRLLIELKVPGNVVPWSTPRTILGGQPGGRRRHVHLKDRRLIEYQDRIRSLYLSRWSENPYTGPVMLTLAFVKATGDESLWGRPWWRATPASGHGDLCNLVKSTEDALKTWKPGGKGGLVLPGIFADDAQVSVTMAWKEWGREDGVKIRVYAIDTEILI